MRREARQRLHKLVIPAKAGTQKLEGEEKVLVAGVRLRENR
jgi:hypothetical protein